MKMMVFLLLFINCFGAFAQTTYDVFSYIAPKGYKKEDKNGYRLFTKIDNKKKSYCLLSLYSSQPSAGSLMQDFNSEWAALVATPFSITAPPETEQAANNNGYEIMGGTETFTHEGKNVVAIQYVYSGYGKVSTVLAVMSSIDYMSDIEKFIDNVKPIAPKGTAKNLNETIVKPNNNKPAAPIKTIEPATANNTKDNFGTGKMEGVWVAYFLSNVTKTMMFDQKVFLINGKFLNDMPIGGVDNFVPNEHNIIRNYTLSGNNGKTFDDANKYPETFTIKAPNKIEFGIRIYFKSVNPNGKFITASYTSWSEQDSPEFKAAPKGDRSVINFYSNGKFEDEGIFKHLQNDDPTKKAGKGTYNIKNYSLYLSYDDGRPVQKFSIATFGEASTFDNAKVLMIGGGHFFKMKNK